ncbi:MAG: hypothetical protein F4047_07895 [Caldilineaceae bacterium SB0670_bin_27]|nr:hypothetical protein [Caldilineaceae bacterium SB0670_bin_27]
MAGDAGGAAGDGGGAARNPGGPGKASRYWWGSGKAPETVLAIADASSTAEVVVALGSVSAM